MTNAEDQSISLETRRRAIRVRAWRRGLREMDILMGGFAEAQLSALNEKDIADFEALLDLPDQQVFSWLCGSVAPPQEWMRPILFKIAEFHRHSSPIHI